MHVDPRTSHREHDGRSEEASSERPSGDTQPASEFLSRQSTDFGLEEPVRPAADDLDPLLGRQLGDVVIERLIDQGGMGRVYLARQRAPARYVAVKAMRPGRGSPAAGDRFRREADLLGRLRHPGIAQVFTAGCGRIGSEDVPYFVMEYVPGARSLVQGCRERGLDSRQRLEILLAVCRAVAHGHAAGIVHRDLKPGNILLDGEGQPKVIDFGVARVMEDDSQDFTETGEFVGTKQYTSPEQCGDEPIGPATDVYALGLIMHELLSGRLPYEVAGKSLSQTVQIVREAPPQRLQFADPALAPGAAAIAAKCLRKRSAARYPSAAELADDIQRLLGGQRPQARLPGRLSYLLAWGRDHRPAVVAGIATVSVILLTAVAMTGSRPPTAAGTAPSSAADSGPTGEFPNVSSLRTTPLQWLTVTFDRPVRSLSTADFQLTRNGVAVPLIGVEVAGERARWEIRGLEKVTAAEGRYMLELRGTRDGPVDFRGRRLAARPRAVWQMPPYREIAFNLLDDAWRKHVVSMTDVECATEQNAGAATFIRPTVPGREGTIVLRFESPFPISAATVTATMAVWTTGDPFPYDPGAKAAIDVSPDGVSWTTLDTRKANQGGFSVEPHDIREVVAGSREVWVRARLTATREWPDDGLIHTQFLRSEPDRPLATPFRLTLTGANPHAKPPPGDAPPADG